MQQISFVIKTQKTMKTVKLPSYDKKLLLKKSTLSFLHISETIKIFIPEIENTIQMEAITTSVQNCTEDTIQCDNVMKTGAF